MRTIAISGNTVVPALLALEHLGFKVLVERDAGQELISASRGDETFVGEDPVEVLGLVKLVESRGWAWRATDADIERVVRQYDLGD